MRASGKTTKLVDAAIQHLFKEGSIRILLNHEIYDDNFFRGYSEKQIEDFKKFIDPDTDRNNKAQREFLKRLTNRLLNEHRGYVEMVNQTTFIVKRLNEKNNN